MASFLSHSDWFPQIHSVSQLGKTTIGAKICINITGQRTAYVAVGSQGERRTLPKSTTRSNEGGQGLLQFFTPPMVKEKLDLLARAPLNRKDEAEGTAENVR